MKLNDLLKQDKERFSKLPDRQSKLNFLWDYYKIPIIVALCALCLIAITLLFRSDHDVSMHVILLNNDSLVVECDDTVFDRLLEEGGYDLQGKQADVNVNYSIGREGSENEDSETIQVLSAMFALDDIDLYVSDKYYFDYFAEVDAFHDLSVLLPEETIQAHEDELYRYDNSFGQSIIGGILLHEGSPLHEAGYYHGDVVLGIATNCGNLEAAQAFILRLLSDRN
ncbi:MAG: hypothetical protein IJL85_03880 [Erysipelotrichaceae bacterium]|nr:hypothetical protein [Erysipelotrichaceae bacterium]